MAAPDEQYFSYENRLASFQEPQPAAKGRVSNKAVSWPHKSLTPVAVMR